MVQKNDNIKEQRYQETLITLGVYALEQDELEAVFQRAVQQSCALLHLKCAAILTLNEEENTFEVAFENGCDCESIDVTLDTNEKWDIEYSLKSKKPVYVLDYGEENRFQISPFMAKKNFVSSAHIAIRGSEKLFGVFGLYSKEKRRFSKLDLYFIQVVSNILGRTIEQKRVNDELQETNARLQVEKNRSELYQKEILSSSLLERWELGSYLHDNFGQLLASAKILIDDIKLRTADSSLNISNELNELNEIVDMSLSGIRNIVHEIIPVDIEKEGVAQAFRLLMTQTYRFYSVNCTLQSNGILNEIKNLEIATHLYHIIQEALKNAATHGKAKNIIVSIEKVNNDFVLQINDDGVGFSEASQNQHGKGLRIMKHRMELMGGTFEIDTYNKIDVSGTMITCTIPFQALKSEKKKKPNLT